MRTEAGWKEQQRAIDAAKVLAEFANLEPDGIASFRVDHPDFAWWIPFWDGIWMGERNRLREGWATGFSADKTLELVTSKPLFLAATQNMKVLPEKTSPYQRAIFFLHVNSWRAKTCEWCGKHFIAEHPKARFCSFKVIIDGNETTCSWAHRKKYKKEKWAEHSDGVNKRRRREYRLIKRNRRGRAKRQNLH